MNIAPLFKEFAYCPAESIFELFHDKKWSIFFDSALTHEDYGRYSYITLEPFKTLWAKDGLLKIDDIPIQSNENPFHLLKQLLAPMAQPNLPHLPPFQGGVAGAFSYDLYQYIESIPPHSLDLMQFPDMALGFYDVVIAFDHFQKQAWIISTGWPEFEEKARQKKAKKRLIYFEQLVSGALYPSVAPSSRDVGLCSSLSSNFNKSTYTKAVQEVIDYILAGDIFEANISQCFSGQLPSHFLPFDLYKKLRKKNSAPFAAFFNLGEFLILSSSPERFLQLIEGQVETRPIKGTRPRSPDRELDQHFANVLQACEKDRAENIMIVDLMRNDLSKVCKDHSVKVKTLCGLESYATVHHLVSVITGELKSDKNAIDLLLAAFPGGSVTGAPKIRAMEIIASIEPGKRGLYCGSLGFIGFNGSMDTSIVIRTIIIKNHIVTFQTGGAIVVDSNPVEEYEETLNKTSVLYELLG